MNFADTNWLEAVYFDAAERTQRTRCDLAQRFMREHGQPLGISHVVYLEARNVFCRNTGETEPEEWRRLLSDLNGLLYLDPMNWDYLRREAFELFAKYSPKCVVGTLDMAILASAKLCGARRFLSFDETLKAVAVAEKIDVFPPLGQAGRRVLAELRRQKALPAAGQVSLKSMAKVTRPKH